MGVEYALNFDADIHLAWDLRSLQQAKLMGAWSPDLNVATRVFDLLEKRFMAEERSSCPLL